MDEKLGRRIGIKSSNTPGTGGYAFDYTKSTARDRPGDEVVSSDEDNDGIEYQEALGQDEEPIDISISGAQNLMRSPTTPAAHKSAVLEQSRSYFAPIRGGLTGFYEEPIVETATSDDESPHIVTRKGSQPDVKPGGTALTDRTQAPQDQGKKRSSAISSILTSTIHPRRHRSNSGSGILDSFRRRLLGSHSTSTSQQTNRNTEATSGPLESSLSDHNAGRQGSGQPSLDSTLASDNIHASDRGVTLDNNDVEASPLPPAVTSTRPGALRRATSDHSLYLRPRPTNATEFDNYHNYSETSEMVNSRFKAITDSLQDSKLRAPSLSNLTSTFRRSQNPQSSERRTTKDMVQDTIATPATTAVPKGGRTEDSGGKKHPNLNQALSRLTGDLVILGGYRGSILREAQSPNRQLWVPVKVGVNLRKVDLELGLTHEDEIKAAESIIPSGPLSHIGPIDICRRLIRKCQRCRSAQEERLRVHDWGYDWRVSPQLISDRLITFLESLKRNQANVPKGERGAWVIAHSLGGLITRHVINRRPDLVAGVVFAGTPQGCVNILGPLRNGDDVLFSSRVLTAQVNFTLRTSYALLPLHGQCFINKATGERYDMDFFDARNWDEYRLSPCIRSPKLRESANKRSSIIGSINIRVPGLNSKSTQQTETRPDSSPSTARDIANKVEDAAEMATSPPAEGPMSPTMQGSSQHSKPSVATAVSLNRDEAYEYLERTLREVRTFKEELAHRSDLQKANRYPPNAIIFSTNTPTVYGAKVSSQEDIKYADAFDDLAFAAGDGVVLASAAQLPVGYKCVRGGRVQSERGHVGLLGDLEGVGKCLNAIIDAREKGVGLGKYDK